MSTELQLHGEEDECINVETDDVDSVLNIFEEITAELLKEGVVMICANKIMYSYGCVRCTEMRMCDMRFRDNSSFVEL